MATKIRDAEPDSGPQWSLVPQEDDPDLIHEFVTESTEHLELAESHLLALDGENPDPDALNATFRAFHTIKGVAGFLGLTPVSRLSHQAENLLDRVRKGRIDLTAEVLDVALDSVDHLKAMTEILREFETGGGNPEAPASTSEVLSRIDDLFDPTAPIETPDERSAAPEAPPKAHLEIKKPKESTGGQGSVRVSAERLDNLVDMIGELVIAESMVTNHDAVRSISDRDFERHVGLLDKITRELQTLGTSMRMVPVRSVFQKMNRLARDLARKSGKPVDIELEGVDTELDKSVVDQIGDPLVHMVRNAIDHGLESDPALRVAAGKPERGRVTLRAFHRGGSIFVEIEDDGRGLDRDKIIARAIERDLIEPEAELDDREILQLLFEPGFSTADAITEVSGRGVGMDVVRRNIEGLRGQVEVHSEVGYGTTVSIRLPLTLAIIEGMVVRVGQDRYIVPTLSVVRIVRPRSEELGTVLERGEFLDQQGEIMPLIRLSEIFEIEFAEGDATRGTALVVEDEGRRVALLVDELIGQQQIVIKSLGPALAKVEGIAGGAILPDGRVGLIVDVGGVAHAARRTARAASREEGR